MKRTLNRLGRQIQSVIDWIRGKDNSEPVKPPQPEPTPELPAPVINPNLLSIWCEASGAYDRGITSAIIWSLRGRAGAHNIRIAHPWYDPWKTHINYAEWVRRMRAAKNEGCIAFAIDTEGWMHSQAVVDEIWRAAKAVNITLLHVPKATLGLGAQPPYTWLDRDFEHSVQFLESRSDGVWLWNYGFDGDGYRQCTQDWRGAGYTGQIGWITDQVRSHGGYQGKHVWRSVVSTAREDGVSFMLFAGNHSSAAKINELRGYYS